MKDMFVKTIQKEIERGSKNSYNRSIFLTTLENTFSQKREKTEVYIQQLQVPADLLVV